MKVYGVVHLKSLPGSPSNRLSIDEIIDAAQEDVNSLVYGGVDGIIIENFGDTPFVKNDISKRTLASFTTCLLYTSPSPRDATLSRMPSSA